MKLLIILQEVICSLLVILFIYTGLNKMLDYEEFKFQLGRSPFVQHLSTFISITLPTGELFVAISLLFRPIRAIGLHASFFLMTIFTGYVYAMLHYSFFLPCSCGGVLASLSWKEHLIFNTFYLVLAFTGIIIHNVIAIRQSAIRI